MSSQSAASGTRTVLFLCTGNYYRSRHAEAVFNHHAAAAGLLWRATSRGLALEYGVYNVGPMAVATIDRLGVLGIPHEVYLRVPQAVAAEDFAGADLIVALKHDEHRPMMAERHPDWTDKVVFWAVHDVDFATPAEALPLIEQEVVALVARLAKEGSGGT